MTRRRRPVLLRGLATAIIGLLVGIVVACTYTEPAAVADDPAGSSAAAASAVAQGTQAGAEEAADRAGGCRRAPTDPTTPMQGSVPHREDHRLPLTVLDGPASMRLERPGQRGFVPIDTTGPPSPALDLSTVLRI
ncbi:hypothetical protein ACFWPA_10000 [Rhodococcus sp. NPDC058505]|uniref:hypothetical protein n=1 Tax=Rhodococcus sp. NPDC058505 TaxID=3346531 RepID=UPI003658C671